MTADAREGRSLAIAAPSDLLVDSQRRRAYVAIKRVLDLFAAIALLLLLLPVLFGVAIAVVIDSGWPILYRGDRVGRGMQTFRVLKFRSMRADADPSVHAAYLRELLQGRVATDGIYKVPDDPRITRVGAFLRKSSLDELPQLMNVVRGDMSLVGPRPEVPYALTDYEPWMFRRFEVSPGITGLWQVKGRGRIGLRDMLRLDVEYAEQCDLALDLQILARTLPAVVRATGAA
jgi:lipopolysaccharide/colanic/teichoic acid biosynthesis glycosyltransferase